jgi:Protein of unknown function (DUF3618)
MTMESESARLEREVEETRWQLSGTLEELRGRMTPGRVVDQVIDYTRDSPAVEFFRNLGRKVRENPLPVMLVGIGITWLLLATNRTSRAAISAAVDNLASTVDDIGTATGAFVNRTSEWGQQTAARVADRASDVASTVGDKTGGKTVWRLSARLQKRTPARGIHMSDRHIIRTPSGDRQFQVL